MPIHHYSMDEPYPIWLLLAGMGLTGTFMWLTGRAMYPELAAWWGGAELGAFKGFMLSFLGFWFLLAFGGFQTMALELVKPFCGCWGTHPISLFAGIVFMRWNHWIFYKNRRKLSDITTFAARPSEQHDDILKRYVPQSPIPRLKSAGRKPCSDALCEAELATIRYMLLTIN